MANFTKNEMLTKDHCVHLYSGISETDLGENVNRLMMSMGYSLKSGLPGNGVYVKGNRTKRLMLGALSKYFKFVVSTAASGEDARVTVGKQTSGMSGGVIGMNQVKKEMRLLAMNLQTI